MNINERKLRKLVREEIGNVVDQNKERKNYEEIGTFGSAGGDYTVRVMRDPVNSPRIQVAKHDGEVALHMSKQTASKLVRFLDTARKSV